MGFMGALKMTEDPEFLYESVEREQKAKTLFFGALSLKPSNN